LREVWELSKSFLGIVVESELGGDVLGEFQRLDCVGTRFGDDVVVVVVIGFGSLRIDVLTICGLPRCIDWIWQSSIHQFVCFLYLHTHEEAKGTCVGTKVLATGHTMLPFAVKAPLASSQARRPSMFLMVMLKECRLVTRHKHIDADLSFRGMYDPSTYRLPSRLSSKIGCCLTSTPR
jgi:hypothetical protein